MQANRSRDTSPELAVRRAVHRLGLRYRVGQRPLPNLRQSADLVFPRAKVAVFVDGCFWHGCPDHYRAPASNRDYWSAKINKNQRRDAAIDAALRHAGWTAVRVWEHDEATAVALHVAQLVRRRSSRAALHGR
jgi:DNA mismatch endonuclease (patch repair protein)